MAPARPASIAVARLACGYPAGVSDSFELSANGAKAWPRLAMFKALLLATWHDLSDVALTEALAERASIRASGLARDEATPRALAHRQPMK